MTFGSFTDLCTGPETDRNTGVEAIVSVINHTSGFYICTCSSLNTFGIRHRKGTVLVLV